MLVTIEKCFQDDFENVVFITKEQTLLKVEENKKSDEKTNVFRYRNLDVFVSDISNNIDNVELFYLVKDLASAGLDNNLLVRPLCALLCGAKIELVQVFVNRDANSYIQNEICSVKVAKLGLKLFVKALRPLITKELLEQIQKDIEEM